MTSLLTIIPKKYINRHNKLFTFYVDEFMHGRGRISSSSRKGNRHPNKMTIADIIDNAEMLFGGKEMMYYCTSNIIGRCQDNKSIDEISKYIIENIK